MQSNILFHFFMLPITDTIIFTWVIMAFLVISSIVLTRNLRHVPSRAQHIIELAVDGIESLVITDLGQRGKVFVPLILAIALFVLTANLIGVLPGAVSPTADLNTTTALALIVLIVAHGAEIRVKGFANYIKGYFSPFWWMAPLNIIGEIAKVVSHAFRLYGNILGGGIILSILYMFLPYVIPVPLIGWFGVFMGLIQTAVFTLLAVAYIQVRLD